MVYTAFGMKTVVISRNTGTMTMEGPARGTANSILNLILYTLRMGVNH
jgi:hypothetical protein